MRSFLIILLLCGTLFGKGKISIHYSKSKAFLNEPIVAKIYVKSDTKPKYITFKWFEQSEIFAKKISESKIKYNRNGWYYKVYYYMVFPQAIGDINIFSQSAKITTIDLKTGITEFQSVQSKPFKLRVSALPRKIKLSGNLSMQLTSNRQTTKENMPVKFTIIVYGHANIEDIKSFKLPIKWATVYSENPRRFFKVIGAKPLTIFLQEFTVVSKKSYTIMPLKLSYYNTQTHLKEELETKPISIKINKPLISKKELLLLAIGILLGVLASLLFKRIRQKRVPSELDIALKRAKSDKERYQLLLPYANKKEYQSLIKELEQRLYEPPNK